MFGLGLKEAKEIADKTPSLIKRERKEEADKIKETLEKQGCVITLKWLFIDCFEFVIEIDYVKYIKRGIKRSVD